MFMWLLGSVGLSTIAITPLLLLGGVAIAWRSRTRSWRDATLPVMRVLSIPLTLMVLLVFALRPGDILPGDSYAINLEPFRDLRTSLESGHLVNIAILNLAGNAAMFLPFGAVVAFVFPRSGILALLVVALAISVAIEVAQTMPTVARSSDITDAIMNTLGALLGFVIVRAASHRIQDRAPSTDLDTGEGRAPESRRDSSSQIRPAASD